MADGAPKQRQEAPLAGLHQEPQQQQQPQQQPQPQPLEQPLPPDQGILRLLRPLKGTMHVPEEVYAREPVVTTPTLRAELLPTKDLGTLRGGRWVCCPGRLAHPQWCLCPLRAVAASPTFRSPPEAHRAASSAVQQMAHNWEWHAVAASSAVQQMAHNWEWHAVAASPTFSSRPCATPSYVPFPVLRLMQLSGPQEVLTCSYGV